MSCRLLVVIFNTWSDLLFQKIKELEGQNDTLKMELHQKHEKSLVSQKPSTSNTLFSIIRWVTCLSKRWYYSYQRFLHLNEANGTFSIESTQLASGTASRIYLASSAFSCNKISIACRLKCTISYWFWWAVYLTSIDCWFEYHFPPMRWRNLRFIVIVLTIQCINRSGFIIIVIFKNVQDLVNQNTLLKEQIEIMNEATVSMFQIF